MTMFESGSGAGGEPAHERRRNPRVSAPWPAIVQDSDGHLIAAEVIDVSLSGMKLRVASQVLVGDAVKLRVTLPRGAGDIEISAQVVRRDPEGIGVDFGRLPPDQAARFRPFVPTWDLRRRAERVEVDLPVQIQGVEAVITGRTVNLSAAGGRVTTAEPLTAGDMVALKLAPNDGHGPMSIRAVVWEVDAGGAVLVFANLPATDFVRLRSYVDSLLIRRS
jgi:c-di-GMP-binding flagellar brake protein YcgR